MSYLLSWSIYLWDLLEGVCVKKNAPQEEVSTWIWYQQLFTQSARRAKVSAWIYYRQLFAKKENLQYKEMIEISRWRLDRSHPYGLWFIYWDPPKIQTSDIRRGGNTKLSKEILFLIHGVLETSLQEGILVKPRTLSRTYQRGKKLPHDFPSVVFDDFLCQNRVLQNTRKPVRKKNWCRLVALITRYDVISSMKSIYFSQKCVLFSQIKMLNCDKNNKIKFFMSWAKKVV